MQMLVAVENILIRGYNQYVQLKIGNMDLYGSDIAGTLHDFMCST